MVAELQEEVPSILGPMLSSPAKTSRPIPSVDFICE